MAHGENADRDMKPAGTNTGAAGSTGSAAAATDDKLAKAYFDYALSGILVTDGELAILRANPAACSIIGLPRHRLLTQRLSSLLETSDANAIRADKHFSLLAEQGIARAELNLPPNPGDAQPRVIETASIDIGEGHLLHVFDDVSAQRQLMLATEQARHAADEANRAKSTFLANMSHEIRTPLNGVIGLGEVLRLTRLDEQQKDHLNKMLQSSRALLDILNDLLDLSKVEAGHMVFEMRPIRFPEMLEELAATALPLAREKGLDARFQIDKGMPSCIMGDRLRLMQVLRNLIGNAIKFTERGTVDLGVDLVAPPGGKAWVRYRVTDSGIGMSPEQQSRLFLPFSQADASTARRFGGTGLGLAISRMLAEGMGGHIELVSEPAKGSTFTVWLPFEPAGEAPAAAMADDAILLERNAFEGASVLVAEDNAINREVIGQLLLHAGIAVTQACNGREALQLLQDHRTFDLVFMDVQMPEMDGLAATRSLRSGGCGLPIVALSAGVSAGERDACEAAGMNDFLAKPIDVGDLAAVLTRWLPPRNSHAAAPPESAIPALTDPAVDAPVKDLEFPGLELEDSLPRFLGRRDLLAWARDTILKEHGATPARLFDLAAAGQWMDMARIAHALRGAAGNIGALDLADSAKALENALQSPEPGHMDPMIEAIHAALANISVAPPGSAS